MYTLYGSARSGAAAIEMALRLAGAEYTTVEASSWHKDSGFETLKRFNPLVQIPTLILPDGSVLTESAAIMIYLGMACPDAGILSTDANVRAQQLRGLVYISANCYAAIGIIDYPERWLDMGSPDQRKQLAEGAVKKLYDQWDMFSDLFFDTRAWQPANPGALEMLACVVSRWSNARAHLSRTRPAFCASLEEAETHPVIKAVVRRHWGT